MFQVFHLTRSQTGKKQLLFDASHAKPSYPKARPLEEQSDRESQKLWHVVTDAVKRKDQDAATNDKARIEDMQREEAAKRNNDGIDWHPQLFRRVQGGPGGIDEGEEDLDWIINAKVYVKVWPLGSEFTDHGIATARLQRNRSSKSSRSQRFYLVKHHVESSAFLHSLEPTPTIQQQRATTLLNRLTRLSPAQMQKSVTQNPTFPSNHNKPLATLSILAIRLLTRA